MLYQFLKKISFTNTKTWICSLLFLSFSSDQPPKSIKWGFYGHRNINFLSVFTLPPEMIGFYRKHISFLKENSVLPDKRRYIIESEGAKHYLDLDHYQNDSLKIGEWIPKYWKGAKEKFSEDTLKAYGVLPWNIQWQLRKLEKAFREKDALLILKTSSELGHYLADAHVPLHTTENYNGQLTGQRGIHGLWESRLVEVYFDDYDFFVGKAKYLEDPLEFIWKVIFESHKYLPDVFEMERIASDSIGPDKKYSYDVKGNALKKVYSRGFITIYHNLMKGMVEKRMRESVITVGSFWFTAWVRAGQPNLNDLSLDKNQLKNETKDSISRYNQKKIKLKRTHEH